MTSNRKTGAVDGMPQYVSYSTYAEARHVSQVERVLPKEVYPSPGDEQVLSSQCHRFQSA
jgi:hypothetical protein